MRSRVGSYVAPGANLLAGWWLLHERQLERFVSGVADDFKVSRRRRRPDHDLSGARASFSLAGFVLEGGLALRQEEPAGPGAVVERYVAVVDLTPHVAADFGLDLPAQSGFAAVATVIDVNWAVPTAWRPRVDALSATVVDGKLQLVLTARADARGRGKHLRLLRALRVAWIVDLSKPCSSSDGSET